MSHFTEHVVKVSKVAYCAYGPKALKKKVVSEGMWVGYEGARLILDYPKDEVLPCPWKVARGSR